MGAADGDLIPVWDHQGAGKLAYIFPGPLGLKITRHI